MGKNIITLRNVYKIKEVHFQPGKMKNGQNFPFVKKVRYDSMGNSEMILSQDELNDPNRNAFIAEDADLVVTDGTQFDLDDPLQRNWWECIKDSDMIVPTRDAKDANGDLYIDGNKKRYGMAEFYVDIPGEESERSISKKKKITKAWTFIENDSTNGRLTKCKILGKYMGNAPDADVEYYLYERAEKDPDSIIELYTSGDMSLKLLLIDARDKHIIVKNNGVYQYGETVLGATDDACLLFFKIPSNSKILKMIRDETYPEYATVSALQEKIDSVNNVEPAEESIKEPVKKTAKK